MGGADFLLPPRAFPFGPGYTLQLLITSSPIEVGTAFRGFRCYP